MISKKVRILCVDDVPINLKLLETVLIQNGYEVIKAVDGREAAVKIAEQRIDLVLLDVIMPGINGFDICKMIKEHERFRNIPVILITALASNEDRIRGIEAGADDFISKPFSQREVLSRIEMLLKMKELNNSLSHAYININNLISFGEEIVKAFDPQVFDFMFRLDSLVNQIIRQTTDRIEMPQIVIIGVSDEDNNWQWYRYESVLGKLERNLLGLDLQHTLNIHKDNPRVVFYNEADLEKQEILQFVKRLGLISITVSNTVCYVSDDLCIFALNYGRNLTTYDASVLNSLVMQTLFLKSLSLQIKELEDSFSYTVRALARASEVNDEDTGNHILRVGEYSSIIAKEIGMSEMFMKTIKTQAQMHDVGKIHTPPEILKKTGKLFPEEWEEIKKHTIYGVKILGEHPRLKMAKNIALTHHERWDGSGYPYGLKGEQIPVEGRILNISDQYDALRNERIYKPAYGYETTYRIITEGDGRTMPHHFDPVVLKAFKETKTQFEEIYERLKG